MTCCKCQQFKWDYPAETVWKDGEEQEYCIFHAPEEFKGVESHKFNQIIFNAIKYAAKQKNVASCLVRLSLGMFLFLLVLLEKTFQKFVFITQSFMEGQVSHGIMQKKV